MKPKSNLDVCSACGQDVQRAEPHSFVQHRIWGTLGMVMCYSTTVGLGMYRVLELTGVNKGTATWWAPENIEVVTGYFHVQTRRQG